MLGISGIYRVDLAMAIRAAVVVMAIVAVLDIVTVLDLVAIIDIITILIVVAILDLSGIEPGIKCEGRCYKVASLASVINAEVAKTVTSLLRLLCLSLAWETLSHSEPSCHS